MLSKAGNLLMRRSAHRTLHGLHATRISPPAAGVGFACTRNDAPAKALEVH